MATAVYSLIVYDSQITVHISTVDNKSAAVIFRNSTPEWPSGLVGSLSIVYGAASSSTLGVILFLLSTALRSARALCAVVIQAISTNTLHTCVESPFNSVYSLLPHMLTLWAESEPNKYRMVVAVELMFSLLSLMIYWVNG